MSIFQQASLFDMFKQTTLVFEKKKCIGNIGNRLNGQWLLLVEKLMFESTTIHKRSTTNDFDLRDKKHVH